MLLIRRLEGDHDAMPQSMRKACTFQQALAKHQACGIFLHFLSQLQRMTPPAEFAESEKSLKGQFASGFMDPDLAHALETQFPPGDLAAVARFVRALRAGGRCFYSSGNAAIRTKR